MMYLQTDTQKWLKPPTFHGMIVVIITEFYCIDTLEQICLQIYMYAPHKPTTYVLKEPPSGMMINGDFISTFTSVIFKKMQITINITVPSFLFTISIH